MSRLKALFQKTHIKFEALKNVEFKYALDIHKYSKPYILKRARGENGNIIKRSKSRNSRHKLMVTSENIRLRRSRKHGDNLTAPEQIDTGRSAEQPTSDKSATENS